LRGNHLTKRRGQVYLVRTPMAQLRRPGKWVSAKREHGKKMATRNLRGSSIFVRSSNQNHFFLPRRNQVTFFLRIHVLQVTFFSRRLSG